MGEPRIGTREEICTICGQAIRWKWKDGEWHVKNYHVHQEQWYQLIDNEQEDNMEFTKEEADRQKALAAEMWNRGIIKGHVCRNIERFIDEHTAPEYPCPGCGENAMPIEAGDGYKGQCLNDGCPVYLTHCWDTKAELSQALKEAHDA